MKQLFMLMLLVLAISTVQAQEKKSSANNDADQVSKVSYQIGDKIKVQYDGIFILYCTITSIPDRWDKKRGYGVVVNYITCNVPHVKIPAYLGKVDFVLYKWIIR